MVSVPSSSIPPESALVLFVTVLLFNVMAPSLSIPPPKTPALFEENVQSLIDTVTTLEFQRPPPKDADVFPVIIVSFIVSAPKFAIPPPFDPAVFPVTAVLRMVRPPELEMPPPSLEALEENVLPLIVRLPELETPPPLLEEKVQPLIVMALAL